MKLINYTQPRLLIADEGKQLRLKTDIPVEEYDGDISAHTPEYATVIFVGEQIQTIEDAEELYVEE